MSVVRFGQEGSDIYVIANCDGNWNCVYCTLENHKVPLSDKKTFLAHINLHRYLGDTVPEWLDEQALDDELK